MITFEKIENHIESMIDSNGNYSRDSQEKLLKLIDKFIEQGEFSQEELRKIQFDFYYYCFSGLKRELINEENTNEKTVNFKSRFEDKTYYNVFKKLFLLDKKRKTVLWSADVIFYLNFQEESRKFLQENDYNIKKLESFSWEHLGKNIINLESALEGATDKIKQIKNLCPNHLKKIDWSKVEMSSHVVVLLAIEEGYELNQKQIQDYFNVIQISLFKNEEKIVNFFAQVLTHSSYFKNTIAKSKNLKDSLGKSFGVSMKEIKKYDECLSPVSKFIFLLAENPIVKYAAMNIKMEEIEKTNYFGKPFLNKEELKEYSEITEQKSIQRKTKKNKI